MVCLMWIVGLGDIYFLVYVPHGCCRLVVKVFVDQVDCHIRPHVKLSFIDGLC